MSSIHDNCDKSNQVKKKKRERTIKDSQESIRIRCKLNEKKEKTRGNVQHPHNNRSPVPCFTLAAASSDKRKAGESPDGSMGRRPLEMKLKLAELLGHFAPVKGSVSLVFFSSAFSSLSLSLPLRRKHHPPNRYFSYHDRSRRKPRVTRGENVQV